MSVELERAMLWHLTQSNTNFSRFKAELEDHVSVVLEDSMSLRIWRLMLSHYEQTSTVLGPEAVRIATEVSLTAPEMEFEFIFTDFRDQVRFRQAWLTHRAMTTALERRDLDSLVTLRTRMGDELRIGARGATPIMSHRQEVMDMYARVQRGETGIPFYWPSMTRATLGMWPGTFTVMQARPGTGKTFVAVISAWHAESEGYKVLVVSPEMSKVEIAERHYCIDANVSYSRLVDGTMSHFEYEALAEYMRVTPDKNIVVMDSSDDLSLDGVKAAIIKEQPDLVVIDALYALRAPGKDRSEIMRNISDWCKWTAKDPNHPVAILALHQLNAEDQSALADQLFWDAYNMFSVAKAEVQTGPDNNPPQLVITNKKIRRGLAAWKQLKIHWDWVSMHFGETADQAHHHARPESLGAVPRPGGPPNISIPPARPIPTTAQPLATAESASQRREHTFDPDVGF